jgi:hypothetical protein
MSDLHLARHIIATMGRFTGRRYQDLYNEIEKMPLAAQRDFNRFLQDVEGEIERERRTFRPFPGGPKIRM